MLCNSWQQLLAAFSFPFSQERGNIQILSSQETGIALSVLDSPSYCVKRQDEVSGEIDEGEDGDYDGENNEIEATEQRVS